MTQHRQPLFRLRDLVSASFIAFTMAIALIGCGTDRTAVGESAKEAVEPPAEQPTPEQIAEAEAKQLEEWRAQQEKTRSVISSLSREELIAGSATKGPQDSEVVLLKFSDFQCGFCARASVQMKDFTAKHDDVLYVYKQLPLESIHPEAMPAAKAAWAAGQQDRFWLYHDGLFAYQNKLGEDYYVELAEQVGLDVEQFNRDRTSPEAAAAIEKDIQLARDLDLRGTPTFVMNELLIPGGAPPEFFDQAVEKAKAGELN